MFCSKPIVSSNVGCVSDEIIHEYNGYIYNNDKDCIKYLSLLIDDKAKREYMGVNSKKLFYKHFTTKNYDTYINMFKTYLLQYNIDI